MQRSLGSNQRYKRQQTRYLDTCLLFTAMCYTNALLMPHHHDNNNNNSCCNNIENMLYNNIWKPDIRFLHWQQTTRFETEKPPKLFKLPLLLCPTLQLQAVGGRGQANLAAGH